MQMLKDLTKTNLVFSKGKALMEMFDREPFIYFPYAAFWTSVQI